MSPWNELNSVLQNQLKPHGYSGHLLSHFGNKITQLEKMIERSALMSESNSVLIIGSTGSGKSALLEFVLKKVFKNKLVKENMLQVFLDGWIHDDDNIALEDITRQLHLREVEDQSLGSFSEKLRLLLTALKSGTKESKSVLFVLKRFELFATHKNQTLLYNLFDIVQSQQTPICVIGLCSRPDVLQTLENRVNSRFSHQKILLNYEITLEDYMDCCKSFLSLNNFSDSKFQKRWNSEIASLLKDKKVKDVIQSHFALQSDIRQLKHLLNFAVLNMKSSDSKLTLEDLEVAYKTYYANHNDNKIIGLSLLEVALVVSMMHLTEIYDGEPFNFEIIFNELDKFLKNRLKWNIEKSVVKKSFEHLLRIELVKPVGDSSSSELKNYMPVRLVMNSFAIKAELEKYENMPSELKNWIDSSLNP